jgi:hypothetical protein
MAILPKAIYMFNAILIKIPMTSIKRDCKINPKVYLDAQKTMNSQAILSKKSNTRGITIYCYRVIAIKTGQY